MSLWAVFFRFLEDNQRELWTQIGEHLWLTTLALSISVAIGLILGILISRYKSITTPVLAVVNGIQTIPSIALLGFLLPIFGIGALPAIIALFLYGLLPIVRNTYSGISQVDSAVKEAALGMGLSPLQVLAKVELPLAIPIIFAGIRTAFVINVGVATLCALIAAGGLGEFIFRGLSTNNPHMILAGAIPAGLMALIFDGLLGLVQRHIYKLRKLLVWLAAGVMVFLIFRSLNLSNEPTKIVAGFPSEFIERGDGYIGLRSTYNLDLDVREMEIGLMYQAVKNGDVDVISAFSTDGRIEAFDLVLLDDDKNYFPPYHAAPMIRNETLERYPEIEGALTQLAGQISDQEMARMNFLVDEENINIHQVAAEFLNSKGFKSSTARNGPPDIIIGSKNFTESFILAELFKLIIENYTSLTVGLKLGFGGTKLLFDAMEQGLIDIYPEYTGTGLLVILKEQADKIRYEKGVVYTHVKTRFLEEYNIHWLPPLGFNNTFALMTRNEFARKNNIRAISDLAEE